MTASILETYQARTRASARAYREAEHVMPCGTSRQAGYWSPYPLTLARGDGVYVWDVDGHRYLDLINNYTSLVHGHAYGPIADATCDQIRNGTAWPAGNLAQTRLAERLVERVAGIDQVRFTNSGTEAAALALAMARVITGRNKLLMARYGYHGSLREFETGSFGHPGPVTYLADFNDLEGFEAVLARHGEEIAAVFIEPVLGSGGVVEGSTAFLHGLQHATRRAGAVFVLDEVLTLRFALGGCQTHFALQPDITLFGKVIGGGFPVGAVGARRELMDVFDPAGNKLFHTGTFNANPVSMTAGDIALRELTQERIDSMHALCADLRDGLVSIASEQGLPLSTNIFGSCCNLYFSDSVPASSLVRTDTETMARFHLAAMNHGLFIAPRGMLALSTVFTRAHLNETLQRAQEAMRDVARAS